jgi:hypothetical protein
VQIFELQADLLKKLEKLVFPHSLGQRATFGIAWRCVWNATASRHSAPNFGTAPVSGPEPVSR